MKKTLIAMAALMAVSSVSFAQEMTGEELFQNNCSKCHGMQGERTPPTPTPINMMPQERIEARLERARGDGPKGNMDRAIQNVTAEQADVIAEYIVTELNPENKMPESEKPAM